MPSGDLSRIKEKMMKVRVILVCTLLLLAAVPSFALPLCAECNYEWNYCETIPGAFERCYDWDGSCRTTFERCSPPRTATVATEWQVASIEISRPSLDSVTITAPAAVAQAEVPEPAPPEQK
jgi:hypothetical protein